MTEVLHMTFWLNIKITYLQETRQNLAPVLNKAKKVNVAQFKRESDLDTESKRKEKKRRDISVYLLSLAVEA